MKIYITKYVFTKGIKVYDESDIIKKCQDYIILHDNECMNNRVMYFKPDWYTDYDDAKIHIKLMVGKKLKSLSKQKLKIEKILDSL